MSFKDFEKVFENYFKQNKDLLTEGIPLIPIAWGAIKFTAGLLLFEEGVDLTVNGYSQIAHLAGIGDGKYSPHWSDVGYDPEGSEGQSTDYKSLKVPGPGAKDWLLTQKFVSIANGAFGMSPIEYVAELNKYYTEPSPIQKRGTGLIFRDKWTKADVIKDKFYNMQGADSGKKSGIARSKKVWDYWIVGNKHPWIRFNYKDADINTGILSVDARGLAYSLIRMHMFGHLIGHKFLGNNFWKRDFVDGKQAPLTKQQQDSYNSYIFGASFGNHGIGLNKRFINSQLAMLNSIYPNGPSDIRKKGFANARGDQALVKFWGEDATGEPFYEAGDSGSYPWVQWYPDSEREEGWVGLVRVGGSKDPRDVDYDEKESSSGVWRIKEPDLHRNQGTFLPEIIPTSKRKTSRKQSGFDMNNYKEELELLFLGADRGAPDGYDSYTINNGKHDWKETIDRYWALVSKRLGGLPSNLDNLNDWGKMAKTNNGLPNGFSKIDTMINQVYGDASGGDKDCLRKWSRGEGTSPCNLIQYLSEIEDQVHKLECAYVLPDKDKRCPQKTVFDPVTSEVGPMETPLEDRKIAGKIIRDISVAKKKEMRNSTDLAGYVYRSLALWGGTPDDYGTSTFKRDYSRAKVPQSRMNLTRNPRRQTDPTNKLQKVSAAFRDRNESTQRRQSSRQISLEEVRSEIKQWYTSLFDKETLNLMIEIYKSIIKGNSDQTLNLSAGVKQELEAMKSKITPTINNENIEEVVKELKQVVDSKRQLKKSLQKIKQTVDGLLTPDMADPDDPEYLKSLVGEQKRISKSKKKSKNYPKPPKPLKDLGIGINNGLAIRIVKFKNFALMYRAKMDLSDSVRVEEIGFWDLKGQPVAYLWMGSIHFHTLDNGQFPEKAMQLEDSFKKSSAYTRALQMKLKMPKVHKDHEAELKAIKAKSDNIKPPFERADHEIENGASPVPFALVHRGKTPGFEAFPEVRPGRKFTYDYQVLSNKKLTIIMFTGKNPFSEKKNLLYSKATGKPIGFITRDNQAHIHSPMSGFPQIDKIGMQFIASLPTSPSKGKEADIRNQRPQIPAGDPKIPAPIAIPKDLPKVLPPPRLKKNDSLGPRKSVKSAPARATKSKKRRVIPPPPIAAAAKDLKKQAPDQKAADSKKIDKAAVAQPVTNFLTKDKSVAALKAALGASEQGYSKNQLKIIQKRLNRDYEIPPLSRIQGNLNKLGYFEGETKTFATERFANLEEQARGQIRIGDNKYGDETYEAIKKLQTALIARGFLKPIKDEGEYTNIDGLYGPNTHKAYKSAIKHSMFSTPQKIQRLEQEKKGQLIQNLNSLNQSPETELQKTWIAWMLGLLKGKKTAEKDTSSEKSVNAVGAPEGSKANNDAALKKSLQTIVTKAKAGKINLKKSPYKGSHEVDWPLWLKIQHMYGNLQLDTKNGVLKTPKPTRQYVELYFAQIEKRGESFKVEPRGALEGWKPSKDEIQTNLGFRVRKYTPPNSFSGLNVKELFIATAALDVPALKKVGKSPKGSSGRNLPIYDKSGKGVGWLIGGRKPVFRSPVPNTAEFIDPEVKKNIPVVEVSETSKNLKFEKIFEDYIRKNERKVKKCV